MVTGFATSPSTKKVIFLIKLTPARNRKNAHFHIRFFSGLLNEVYKIFVHQGGQKMLAIKVRGIKNPSILYGKFLQIQWLVSFDPLEIQKLYIPLLKGLNNVF